MATPITVTDITRTGIADPAEVTGDTVVGNECTNDGRVVLRVRNAHATVPQTATFITPGSIDGLAVTDRALSVPAASTRWIGPFPAAIYGTLLVFNSSTVDLKYSAFKVPRA